MVDADEQLNVLVIDDDEAMRALLTEVVTRRGHQVVVVESAEEGLETLPYWTFQLAFLDQQLPGMEGLVLGEYLRRNNPDMTIALITGETDARLPKESRALGICFLQKPFDIRAIDGLIDETLGGARSRRELRLRCDEPDYVPRFAPFFGELTPAFGMSKVPERVSHKLLETVKHCLFDLRSVGRYSERMRVRALAGLLTARVLGLELPRLPSGRTLYEEYDACMQQHGRRREFSED